ncbi:MAG: FAD-dependent oxidoreductase, partial [Okeania sp. SIO3H1]|nr:FAD-dependent oxidoreductase [Okeania sp. SIO3H1]
LTVPLGVLQHERIEFIPGLPNQKTKAISTLGMGCLNKVYLRFPERFWSNDVQGFSSFGSRAGQWSSWLNMNYYQPEPILLAFNAGSFGRELEKLGDEEIIGEAMKVLKRIYGKDIPTPTGVQITRWASDPFAFGSYSSLRPGSNRSTIQALRKPLNQRVFFAGEATSLDYPSTVHGAYLSGIRAANEILDVLG